MLVTMIVHWIKVSLVDFAVVAICCCILIRGDIMHVNLLIMIEMMV